MTDLAISTLLTPIKIGALPLEHRVVMAPLSACGLGDLE